MTRVSFSLVALLLALGSGCADDPHLSVLGNVEIEVDGSTTGFEFAQQTNLIEEDLLEPGETLFAGHCRIGETEEGRFVSVALVRPDAASEGIQAERFRIRMPVDGGTRGSRVEALLGGTDFSATLDDAGCDVTVDYVSSDDAIAGLTFDCTMRDADNVAARAVGELHYGACTAQ